MPEVCCEAAFRFCVSDIKLRVLQLSFSRSHLLGMWENSSWSFPRSAVCGRPARQSRTANAAALMKEGLLQSRHSTSSSSSSSFFFFCTSISSESLMRSSPPSPSHTPPGAALFLPAECCNSPPTIPPSPTVTAAHPPGTPTPTLSLRLRLHPREGWRAEKQQRVDFLLEGKPSTENSR